MALRSLKIMGLCLASMFVMGAALAENAKSALLWLVCLKGTGLTKYENSKCLRASGASSSSEGWQSTGVGLGQEITIKILPLTLSWRAPGGILGDWEIQCFDKGGRGEGTIEDEGKGKISTFEFENPREHCRGIESCNKEEVEAMKSFRLPWELEVIETEKKLSAEIPKSSIGAPGWEFTCNTISGKKTFDCAFTEKTEWAELANVVAGSELLVKGTFESRGTGCTLGGVFTISLPGGALSINR